MDAMTNTLRQLAFLKGANHVMSRLHAAGYLKCSMDVVHDFERDAEAKAACEYPVEPLAKDKRAS